VAGSPLRRLRGWLSRTLVEPPLPLVAVEVRPRAVAAVRLVRDGARLGLGAAAAVELRDGTLELSLGKPNIVDAGALSAALRAVLERAGALSGGPVSLVLPDPVVRLTLVPATGLRGRRAELDETVRFRLQKALPADFDVRSARLAWRPVSADELLVAVARDEVVSSYEAALSALGFEPGLVEPAGLALASLADGDGEEAERLLVNWDHGYVSVQLWRGSRPLLLRTLPREDAKDAVARHVAQTLRFHREQLGGQDVDAVLLRAGALDPAEASDVIARAAGVVPRLVQPWAALGDTEDGSEAQSVAGAAACVLRRAA
jgi:Tfp pilus assembly PilM family ATPase